MPTISKAIQQINGNTIILGSMRADTNNVFFFCSGLFSMSNENEMCRPFEMNIGKMLEMLESHTFQTWISPQFLQQIRIKEKEKNHFKSVKYR